MKNIVRNLFFIFFVVISSQAFAERGCESLNIFLDLALKQKRTVSQATDIEKRLHSLMDEGAEVRFLDGDNYVEARNLRYENGNVVFTKTDGTEITQKIDDDFNEFFKFESEIPKPEAAVAQVDEAKSNAVVPAGDTGKPELSIDMYRQLESERRNPTGPGINLTTEQPVNRVDEVTDNLPVPVKGNDNLPVVAGRTDVQPYVHTGEIVEPGTSVTLRRQPVADIEDSSKIIDLDPSDYTVIDDVQTLPGRTTSNGSSGAIGGPNGQARLNGPGELKAIEGPDPLPALPAPIPRVKAADIPDEGRFITFKNADGEDVVGRVIGTSDNDDLRVVVKGTKNERTGREQVVSLDSIQPGSLREIPESEVPYQLIRRPTSNEIPEKGQVFTYTSPKQESSYTARVVGEPTDASVMVERVNRSGELKTERIFFKDMRAESIQTVNAGEIPAAFASTGTDIVPAGNRAVAVVDDGQEVVSNGPGTAIALRDNTLPVAKGTEIETRPLTGEVLGPEIAVREKPAGLLESPVIEGTYTRVDDTSNALSGGGRSTPAISYEQSALALKTPPKQFNAAEFGDFYGSAAVRITYRGNSEVGQFKGVKDGKVLFDSNGKILEIEPGSINRADLDVLDMNMFKRSDSDLVFTKENYEPFKGPFGALDDAGVRVSDDEVMDILRGGGRFKRMVDGMLEIVSKGGKKIRISGKKLLDSGVTMANKVGDLRVNFNRIAKLSKPGRGLQDSWSFIWSDDKSANGTPPPAATTTDPTAGNDDSSQTTSGPNVSENTGNGDETGDSDDDDGGGRDDFGIPPAPSGNPVGPQFQNQQKLKIIRTRGVY